MNATPPKRSLQFLRWFCREDYLDEIEGDLIEIFHHSEHSPTKARRQFFFNVLRHLRPEFIRSFKPNLHYNTRAMFRNYFKTSTRNLLRNKSYAFINIAGLATGVAVCLMIFIVIQYQTSFDDFHPQKDRIYRVLTASYHDEGANITYTQGVPYVLPNAMKKAFPQVEQAASIFASHNDELLIPDENGVTVKKFKEERGLYFIDSSFVKIFDFPLLAGSYASLKSRNNVFLTKEIAEKYFGNWQEAMGKTIKLQSGGFMFEHGTDILKVTGILAPIPANTDFQFKLVASYGSSFTEWIMQNSTNWDEKPTDFGSYVLLRANTSVADFNLQLSAWSRKVHSPENKDTHLIQSLSAVHYDVQSGDFSGKTISRPLLNVLWLIGAFILCIACVNFINLSTTQAINRSKEVGVRKVLGSNKSQLQMQFFVETFLIVISAVVIAAGITLLALPSLNRLLELSVSFDILHDPTISLFLMAVTIVVTLLAGFYPAIVLSRFNPVNALKQKFASGAGKGISLRRGLVVFQFIIAQTLIIGTLIIVKQMNYFMNQPLGFDKDAIVNVAFRTDSVRLSRLDFLRKELLSVSGVQAVSYNSNTPVENDKDMWNTIRFNHAATETDFNAITKFVDAEYLPTYKLPLVAGRNLHASYMTGDFLVNESLVRMLGLKKPEDILNKQISMWGDRITGPVVGVLKDFNDRSFRNDVAPLVMTTNITMYNQAAVKIETKDIGSTMQTVNKIWEQTFPDFVFQYKFLDEKIENFYKQENQLAQLYKIFAGIAIFLSCLGLYGLASFMAVQRVKEVGIRKVLGASSANIVYLFSREFILLISIAFVIATPVAWYYMHNWLQEYAYRIDIPWWLFAAGGLAAIFIALATISAHAFNAALANPVKSLRSE